MVCGHPQLTQFFPSPAPSAGSGLCRVSGLFDAATFVPLACMEMRGTGPYRVGALRSASIALGFHRVSGAVRLRLRFLSGS